MSNSNMDSAHNKLITRRIAIESEAHASVTIPTQQFFFIPATYNSISQ